MHGLSNDFVVVDAINQNFIPTPQQCKVIADRRLGIGCDQILLVQPPQDTATEFYYRIFNRDGSEVEQCGNGARCIAKFLLAHDLSRSQDIAVGTKAGIIYLAIEADGQVRVNMGLPRLNPQDIPFLAGLSRPQYNLSVDGETFEVGAVSMGNPHVVLQVAELDQAPLKRLGPRIENHPRFPNKVNVGFMQVLGHDHIRLRVHERGVGETPACGTGACAAMVVGKRQGLLDERTKVSLPGGDLIIQWSGAEDAPVWMTGPAVLVFEGSIEL